MREKRDKDGGEESDEGGDGIGDLSIFVAVEGE